MNIKLSCQNGIRNSSISNSVNITSYLSLTEPLGGVTSMEDIKHHGDHGCSNTPAVKLHVIMSVGFGVDGATTHVLPIPAQGVIAGTCVRKKINFARHGVKERCTRLLFTNPLFTAL